MASNFKILIRRSEGSIHLGLHGDFDGSSAHELINLLKKYSHSDAEIHIYTDGLNQLHPFGMRIFTKSIGIMNDCADRILFFGDKASDFENPFVYSSL